MTNIKTHTFTAAEIAAIRRYKPATKWVVPTQADIDAVSEPIPCKVRDVEDSDWAEQALYSIDKFSKWHFLTQSCRWKYCLIQVPANDPREAVEVKS